MNNNYNGYNNMNGNNYIQNYNGNPSISNSKSLPVTMKNSSSKHFDFTNVVSG